MKIVEVPLLWAQPLVLRPSSWFAVLHHVDHPLPPGLINTARIHSWHLDRGWAGCAYHYIILADGTIERGRPRLMQGSHCKGYNTESIGICTVGDFTTCPPSLAQLASLYGLLAELCQIYGWTPSAATIKGHRDCVLSTACPGDAFYAILPEVRREVQALCAR